MDRITLKGIAIYGYHGVLAEEQRIGQRFFIDVVLSLDLQKAGRTDDLGDTVNYAEVYRIAKEIAEGIPRALIEKVAGDIGRAVLAAFPQVVSAEVTVHKPSAPVPGILEEAAVTVEVKRE